MGNLNGSGLDIFGVSFASKELNVKDLPVYITAGRLFYELSYGDIRFLLISVKDERFGSIALEKQLQIIVDKYKMPAAFFFRSATEQQRSSLIERNIPFIIDNNQVFLPFLGISLSKRFVHQKSNPPQKMMPVTQMLFLYLLYRSKGRPVMKKNAAEELGITRTSITRACDQLLSLGLIEEEKCGKEHYMVMTGLELPDEGMKLYKKAQPYLINPIQRSLVTECSDTYADYPFSGEYALSVHSMLNPPAIRSIAVDKSKISATDIIEIDPKWDNSKDLVRLDFWKYDPGLFTFSGTVDPISLALSLEGNEDERVEAAIEEYLEMCI